MGDNSIFNKASEAKLKTDIAKWQERLEMAKAPSIIEGLGKFDPDKYFEYIEEQGIIEDKETDVVDNGKGTYDVTTKPGYIFEVELLPSQDNPTDAKIEYIGQAGKIAPIIKRIETSATSTSITAKAIVTRLGNGTVTYYYKLKTEADSEYKEITNVNSEIGATQSTGITAGTEYTIKVVAKNEAGETIDIAEITATKVFVESIAITPNPATVKEAKTVTLIAKILPDNATNKHVTWTSKNTDIAMVDENGMVTGVKEGTATVEVTSTDGSNKVATCIVTVKPLTVAEIVGEVQKSNKAVKDENGNQIVIPGGFKVVADRTGDVQYNYNTNRSPAVQNGIVIEDEEGNQFVWIPVGEIKNKDNTTTTITLGRYTFNSSNGTPSLKQNALYYNANITVQSYFEELTGSSKCTVAKNLGDFAAKTQANGGYYIGRYEASEGTDRKVDIKSNKVAWRLGQANAATEARRMYNSNYVESDLMNSYSWDTAIVFIQKYSFNSNYANKGVSSINVANTGTTGDKVCNIHDLALNYREWTTEYSSHSAGHCTLRGGAESNISGTKTCTREPTAGLAMTGVSFRTILYLK